MTEQQDPGRPDGPSRGSMVTTVVTNATKVAGIVLGLHEGLSSSPRSSVLMIAALMLLGAQGVEDLFNRLIGREK